MDPQQEQHPQPTSTAGDGGAVTLIVNTREYPHHGQTLSFEEAVAHVADQLPNGPQVTYTVTFTEADDECREGSLVRGGKPIKVKDRMIVCVKHSHES
jgi:hypothetical protein